MYASEPSRSTLDRFVYYRQEDRSGQPSCAITRQISGLATSCRSQISSFDRSQAFFIIELNSRRVIHVGVTRSPTDTWVAQQLREATPYGQAPKYLIRDNDSKFGPCFARVATTSAIEILKTPYHAPRANAICERFLRSVRQECLDTMCWSSARSSCSACSISMWRTSTGPDRIKVFSNRFLNRANHLIPRIKQGTR
jgi:hypothetical protein